MPNAHSSLTLARTNAVLVESETRAGFDPLTTAGPMKPFQPVPDLMES